MTTGQTLALLDAAMRSPHPLIFLDAVVTTFTAIGRHQDATATAWVRCLFADDEIEALMRLRAAWGRGEQASSSEMARDVVRRRRMAGDALAQKGVRSRARRASGEAPPWR